MGEVLASVRRKGTARSPIGHVSGTTDGDSFLMVARRLGGTRLDLGLFVRAGEGNRTLMTSLEGWGSTIELRPHRPSQP